MEASPSRSDSFSRAWLGCRASIERLDADAGLGCSFNSSTSFIDMDPAELFSMRWTCSAAAAAEDDDVEEEAAEFDFGQLTRAGAQCFSPMLVGAGQPLLACEPGVVSYSYVSSPAFYSARSTPASAASSRRRGRHAPLVATRRILLRYLRLLAPLCRKVRALPVRALAPRSSSASRAAFGAAATTSSPARQSTSSYASATEYWCHGHADTAVSDAILYCKKSIQGRQDAV
ncbi:hypothetical protein D1007_25042 [Hordeum vulgare]|uniref:Membrane-associated kinase regulator 6 n=1 Tax=Hordeum vulgare subsp. vulgare TaxID=112509 RepID=A0A8I6WT30_HORVV|nr:uncharacterized protein LOC123410839 [Hordeum vulgare subsp. vulgare]KAE8799470.1 hypothetical protein D1007_25042 [Hordeum vulgare]KAI5017610.1 hypothetical protein ZWY2020_042498 [Hordeum vulgare]